MSFESAKQVLNSNQTVSEPFFAVGKNQIWLLGIGTADPATTNWFLQSIPKGADQSVDDNWNEMHTRAFSNDDARRGMEFDAAPAAFYRLNNKASGTATSGVEAFIARIPVVIYE